MDIFLYSPWFTLYSIHLSCNQGYSLLVLFLPPSLASYVYIYMVNLYWLQPAAALFPISWWRHQMETFSALLAICAGNSPVPGEFPAQRPVMRSSDVFFDLRLNKWLSNQSWGWWWHYDVIVMSLCGTLHMSSLARPSCYTIPLLPIPCSFYHSICTTPL